MLRRIGCVLVGLAALSAAASAEGDRYAKSERADWRVAPVKDCTRFNGRSGYYGNPWCTPQEQARWDRWSAERAWVH
jgi:hypothetical protein